MTRWLAVPVLLVSLALPACGRDDFYVQANAAIVEALPQFPGAELTSVTSAPYYDEGLFNRPVGYTTLAQYTVPREATVQAVAAFYQSRLGTGWTCDRHVERYRHPGTMIFVSCTRGTASVSLNTDNMYSTPPRFEIAVDHDGSH